MNKKRVDELIPHAYEVINKVHICENDKKDPEKLVVDSTYSSYTSSFGAAVTMGSLISAIAFFSSSPDDNRKRTKTDRTKIGIAIFEILKLWNRDIKDNSLYDYAKNQMDHGHTRQAKELILDAAVALKLALNLYPKKKKEEGDQK